MPLTGDLRPSYQQGFTPQPVMPSAYTNARAERISQGYPSIGDTANIISSMASHLRTDLFGTLLGQHNNDIQAGVSPTSSGPIYSPPSDGGGAPRAAAKSLDYLNADLAQYYGMDKTTAYQEALSNTGYQRAVADMQRAGLNPAFLFGSSTGNQAGGVYSAHPAASGGGYSPARTSSGSAKSNYLFSPTTYNALQVLGGGLAVAVTKRPSSYFAGSAAAKGLVTVLNGLFK